jgi:hypothetical protein
MRGEVDVAQEGEVDAAQEGEVDAAQEGAALPGLLVSDADGRPGEGGGGGGVRAGSEAAGRTKVFFSAKFRAGY